jgi:hypothetical protein
VEDAVFLVLRQTSLTGKEKCHSTIPFEREAEESRNFKLRMIERFKTEGINDNRGRQRMKSAFCERR